MTRPDTLALIEDLHAAGIGLAVCSNAPTSMGRGLAAQPWAHRFGHLIFSGDLGVLKPEPAIYDAVLAATGAAAEHTVFFDDGSRTSRAHAASAGTRSATPMASRPVVILPTSGCGSEDQDQQRKWPPPRTYGDKAAASPALLAVCRARAGCAAIWRRDERMPSREPGCWWWSASPDDSPRWLGARVAGAGRRGSAHLRRSRSPSPSCCRVAS